MQNFTDHCDSLAQQASARPSPAAVTVDDCNMPSTQALADACISGRWIVHLTTLLSGQEGPSQSSGQAPLGACQLLQHAAEHLTPMLAQAMPAHAPDAERADSASRKRAKLAGAIHHLTSISSHTVQPGASVMVLAPSMLLCLKA